MQSIIDEPSQIDVFTFNMFSVLCLHLLDFTQFHVQQQQKQQQAHVSRSGVVYPAHTYHLYNTNTVTQKLRFCNRV